MTIERAQAADAAALTDIAFAAKRYWGYPESWMECWRDVLTVQPEFIAHQETFVARVEGRPVAFYAVAPRNSRLELVHFWVGPDAMGRGIGRALFTHAIDRAKALGYRALEIESDPHAEGFYLRMGARRVGACVREVNGQSRELPVLGYEIGW